MLYSSQINCVESCLLRKLCLSHELQGIFFFKYYTSTNTICLPHVNWLVHDVHARLVLKEWQTLALGVVGGVSRLMANPAKNLLISVPQIFPWWLITRRTLQRGTPVLPAGTSTDVSVEGDRVFSFSVVVLHGFSDLSVHSTVLCASNNDASHRNPMQFKEKFIIQVNILWSARPILYVLLWWWESI